VQLWWQQFSFIFLRTNVQIHVSDPIPHRVAAPYEELFFLGHSPPLPYGSRRLWTHIISIRQVAAYDRDESALYFTQTRTSKLQKPEENIRLTKS